MNKAQRMALDLYPHDLFKQAAYIEGWQAAETFFLSELEDLKSKLEAATAAVQNSEDPSRR